jgi:dihydroorotase
VTAAKANEISLRRPDDWHLHVRDGDSLRAVIGFTAERFGRAIIMPNLKPPVTTTDLAAAYRKRIVEALPPSSGRRARFEPLMTLYLTDRTDPSEVNRAKTSGFVHGFKLYPAGATTNSDSGVTRMENIYPVLERMSELGVVLQVHGEVTQGDVDVFDREARFIDAVLTPVVERFPRLKVVFEHITTKLAVEFVESARPGVGATITPQHLLHNRNAIFAGGIRPHYYCLPVLKTEADRVALVEAASSGNPRFFLGTDSAPHARHTKETACGCAGMFSAHAGIELYAEAFEAAGALPRLEAFASDFGADFYGLPRNTARIKLVKEPWAVPLHYAYGADELVPMRAGGEITWRLVR